ncbi:DUF2529 family protein [Sporosarcina limicola]|uniref:DUF2529 domain-containing protein n=1 Tax=Sporosarcina limicola TaxID=34101 RepID=A0A927MMA4_9BACL|nr:DUF2529 family protein [Sporosarcina limicola]MBE1555727.1 hypothetical protein [Sporosarcina limicola]
MKILTTQIGGLFQRIATNNEESIEETARLLAQATIGEGRVIFAGFDEMEAVTVTALCSIEPFSGGIRYMEDMEVEKADRVWLLTRSSTDPRALGLARLLADRFIPFAALSADKTNEANELANLAYTYIPTALIKGLLPGDNGERIVQPHTMAALFVYEAVKLAYDEMLSDEN